MRSYKSSSGSDKSLHLGDARTYTYKGRTYRLKHPARWQKSGRSIKPATKAWSMGRTKYFYGSNSLSKARKWAKNMITRYGR
jgi:hypothetical protein